MRLELTHSELSALTRGGVPIDAIAEARKTSRSTVVESTMARASGPPKPAPRGPVLPNPQPARGPAALRRGIFARLLDARFGVRCWLLIIALTLCFPTRAFAQSATPHAVQPLSETLAGPSADQPDSIEEHPAPFLDRILMLMSRWEPGQLMPVPIGDDDDSPEQHPMTPATGLDTAPLNDRAVPVAEPEPVPSDEMVPACEPLPAPSLVSADAELPGSIEVPEAKPMPHLLMSDRNPSTAWMSSAVALLFIAALMFLVWQLRGIEARVEQLTRRGSLAQQGWLDICIRHDGGIQVAVSPGARGIATAPYTDPTRDALPPRMTTKAAVFADGSAWRTGMATHTGRRDDNQDAAKVLTIVRTGEAGYEFFDVAVLADGLGGEPGGRRASLLATEWAASSIVAQLDSGSGQFDSVVGKAMKAAANALRRDADELGVEEGLRTTLVISVVSRETGLGAVASIGDSEVFIRRSDGAVERCVRPQKGMAPHQVAACLGPEQFGEPQIVAVTLAAGDMLILASDGVVQPDEGRLSPADAAHALVFQAAVRNCALSEAALSVIDDNLDRGGVDIVGHPVFDDNQTIVVIGTGRSPASIEVPPGFRLSA